MLSLSASSCTWFAADYGPVSVWSPCPPARMSLRFVFNQQKPRLGNMPFAGSKQNWSIFFLDLEAQVSLLTCF